MAYDVIRMSLTCLFATKNVETSLVTSFTSTCGSTHKSVPY